MTTRKKALAKKESTAVAVPDYINQGTARGSEDVGAEDLVIPRLELVQSLSKCRKKSDPAFIEGIEEGMLYNNVTRQIYGKSVVVCPVMFKKEYLLWRDQDLGGGFGGAHPTKADGEVARQEQEKPDEWEVVDTHQHFCVLVHEDGTFEEIAISMAKSKARISRNWNSLIRINGGDRFARVYKVEGVEDQNDAGKDYYNLKVSGAGFPAEGVYHHAESIYEMMKAGGVSVDRSTDDIIVDSDAEDEM